MKKLSIIVAVTLCLSATQAASLSYAGEQKSEKRVVSADTSNFKSAKDQRKQIQAASDRVVALQKLALENQVGGNLDPRSAKLKVTLDDLQADLQSALELLENQSKLEVLETEDLLNRLKQAETLSSTVEKEVDDTTNTTIGKVG